MLTRLLLFGSILLTVAVAALGALLGQAHLAVRRERRALPSVSAVAATDDDGGPVRLSVINTATQPMPRSGVLDAAQDPQPQRPYVMSHPSFALEWEDGRILLIDTGMTAEQAVGFGRTIEWIGGQPLQALGSAADRLGGERRRLRAVLFTHLHTDHTGGIVELCKGLGHPIEVWMSEAQAERTNYTTRPGLRLVDEAGCVRKDRLEAAPLMAVPGYPGVHVIDAGGHTPGSQIIVANVRDGQDRRRYVFTGDIVNNIDGIAYDVPKPYLYRMLVVPEDNVRQSELRRFLKDLSGSGFALLVSHDQQQIEASGVPAWGATVR